MQQAQQRLALNQQQRKSSRRHPIQIEPVLEDAVLHDIGNPCRASSLTLRHVQEQSHRRNQPRTPRFAYPRAGQPESAGNELPSSERSKILFCVATRNGELPLALAEFIAATEICVSKRNG